MSDLLTHPLAQGDGEFISAILFAIIFGFVSLINWLQKRNQEKRQRQMQAPPPPVQPEAPPRRAQPSASQKAQQNRQRMQQVLQRQREQQRLQQRVQRLPQSQGPARRAPAPQRVQQPPQPPKPPLPEPMPVLAPARTTLPGDISTTEISDAKPRRESQASVTAAHVRRALAPKNLRRNYILTEILQPPVSLREQQ